MRRLAASSVLLIALGSVSHLLAQSSSGTSSTAPAPDPATATAPTADPATQSPDTKTPDTQTPDPNAQPSDQNPQPSPTGAQGTPPRGAPRATTPNPGARAGSVSLTDKVTMGGYGSVRYETNSLKEPNKPAGFDFRRFVLSTEATPNERLQAYIEVEFERLGQIEVERALQRTATGTAFTEGLEGGNQAEITVEEAFGQFKFGTPLWVRFGEVLVPLGRFNINHDDDRWDIPRRTLVDRNVPILPVEAAWTELGFGGTGSVTVGKSGQLSYQGYVFNGATLDFSVEKAIESQANEPGVIRLASEFSLQRGPVNGQGGVRAAGWRVMYSPGLNYEIAVSNYEGGYTPDFFEPSDAHLSAWGIDGLYKHKTFALEGEWIHTHFGDLPAVEHAFVNAVTGSTGIAPLAGADGTEAEFTLTNLSPNRYGFWLEGRYSFWPKKWTKNTLAKGFEDPQLTWVGRFERATVKDLVDEISIENGEISTGEPTTLRQQRLTIGLAYRPIQSVVFSVAMEHNWRLEGPVLLFPFGQPAQAYTDLLVGLAFGF